jgi:WD40 repeat protein
LATAGIDKLIRLWDADTGQVKRTLAGAAWNGISSLAFSPNGQWLASGGSGPEEGGAVRLWDLSTGRSKYVFTGGNSGFRRDTTTRVVFSPDSKKLFAIGQVGDLEMPQWSVRAWETSTGRETEPIFQRSGHARALSIEPNGSQLAIGTWESEVVIVRLNGP